MKEILLNIIKKPGRTLNMKSNIKSNVNNPIKYLEFSEEYNDNADLIFMFHPIGVHSTNKYKTYNTKIVIDELMEDSNGFIPIIQTECNCGAFKNVKKNCKHIDHAIKVLESYGYKLKVIELNRYWCTNCKKETQTLKNIEVICPDCELKMREANNRKIEEGGRT